MRTLVFRCFRFITMAFLMVVCFPACKKAEVESVVSLDVFRSVDVEDLPAGLAARVNSFFSDIIAGDLANSIEHVSAEHRGIDIADDKGATPNYLCELLVDHPEMFDEGAPFPLIHKQFPEMDAAAVIDSLSGATVTDLETFEEGGAKVYLVKGELTTTGGKTGRFCLRLREEPGSNDPADMSNYFIYPSAVG